VVTSRKRCKIETLLLQITNRKCYGVISNDIELPFPFQTFSIAILRTIEQHLTIFQPAHDVARSLCDGWATQPYLSFEDKKTPELREAFLQRGSFCPQRVRWDSRREDFKSGDHITQSETYDGTVVRRHCHRQLCKPRHRSKETPVLREKFFFRKIY